MYPVIALEDLSCLGKCSLTLIHPVLSAMGVPCAPLPTAVLSTHTAFPGPAVLSLTGFAAQTLDHWTGLNVQFSGVLTGYLADGNQVRLAHQMLDRFAPEDIPVIVDPAMADHGKLYSGLPADMPTQMLTLCRRASLCLPNLTEAALMAGLAPQPRTDLSYCRMLAQALQRLGCGAVMLTGFQPEEDLVGYYYFNGAEESWDTRPRLSRACHGTGDLFAGALTGAMLRGLSPAQGAGLAMDLIRRAIASTPADSRWGVAFEPHLGWLAQETDRLCSK